MRRSTVFVDRADFLNAFGRCCREYSLLHVAVAWCGDPARVLPHELIAKFRGNLTATIGVGFSRTHPDAIAWLNSIGADIRIVEDIGGLFHPKVYLFKDGRRYALFVGSSNLTFDGFYGNIEINTLIEGLRTRGDSDDIAVLDRQLGAWHAMGRRPSARWLERYRREYARTAARERRHGIPSDRQTEERATDGQWLPHADWVAYVGSVRAALRKRGPSESDYLAVLRAARSRLPVPWRLAYFDDMDRRRIVGGLREYGWLGHVAAAGQFRQLLAKGPGRKLKILVDAINRIAAFQPPVPWESLEAELTRLCGLGFTMKVWGRLLALVRPDLYCTVANQRVRAGLARALRIPQATLERPAGYVDLIRHIHGMPWFRSSRPRDRSDAALWDARAALLDAIFYHDKGPPARTIAADGE